MRSTIRWVATALAVLSPVIARDSAAQIAGAAIGEFQRLQSALREARAKQDWPSSHASAIRLKAFLNGSPRSLLEVARAQVRIGDPDAAMRELGQFVRMGQSIDLLAASTEFATLRDRPGFVEIQNGLKQNQGEIALGATAFVLPDEDLLAEDIDYDPSTQRFFVTSIRHKMLIAVSDDGASIDFARAPDGWPMLAVKVDSARGVVWATEVAMRGLVYAPQAAWGRSALLCYDAKTGTLLRRIEGPPGSALGDMTLAANGDVIVSDGEGGGVYRVRRDGSEWERLDGGQFISPQTPAIDPDGQHLFVPDYVRGIGVLDLATRQVRWLATNGRFALNGIDGLYLDGRQLIAVQNGTTPERVVVFTLDRSRASIESEQVIERATSTLGDPTHGVVVRGTFHYIANSGWDVVDEHGTVKSGAKPSAPRIMRARLPGS